MNCYPTPTITELELVDCPDGSQAATLAEFPAATATELVDCPDGSQAATLAECPAATTAPFAPTLVPSGEIENAACVADANSPACLQSVENFNKLPGSAKAVYCDENTTFPGCNSLTTGQTPTTTGTTTPGAPSNSLPADPGSESLKNEFCKVSSEAPFCKASTTTTGTTTPPAGQTPPETTEPTEPPGQVPAIDPAVENKKKEVCSDTPNSPICKTQPGQIPTCKDSPTAPGCRDGDLPVEPGSIVCGGTSTYPGCKGELPPDAPYCVNNKNSAACFQTVTGGNPPPAVPAEPAGPAPVEPTDPEPMDDTVFRGTSNDFGNGFEPGTGEPLPPPTETGATEATVGLAATPPAEAPALNPKETYIEEICPSDHPVCTKPELISEKYIVDGMCNK